MNGVTNTAPGAGPLLLRGERLRSDPTPLWKEWTLTNGLGGYAMGSVLGTPTRRYHGLLVSAERPPVERVVGLTQTHETLMLGEGGKDERRVHLTPLHFAGNDERAEDIAELVSFELGQDCRWTYEIVGPGGAPVTVTKTLHLFGRRNACAIEYSIEGEGTPWRIEIRPLVALRGFHEVRDEHDFEGRFISRTLDGGMVISTGARGLRLWCRGARLAHAPERWRGIHYAWEQRRGLEDREDLFSPGVAHAAGSGAEAHSILLCVSSDADELPDLVHDRNDERDRLNALVRSAEERAPGQLDALDRLALARLVRASDQFIVRRGQDDSGVSVIAGYPWFSDWGRDAMISLPGLLLTTGRCDEALGVLRTFAGAARNGLIPNRFDDYAGENHYNTVDASLWFVHACCEYLRVSNDRAGFDALVPACLDVIDAYERGTDYEISMDPADGLVRAGNETTQLTWMDAQRGGITFTPRHGKAVEINALWFNALASLSDKLQNADQTRSGQLRALADRVGSAIRASFVLPEGGLIDHFVPDGPGRWQASTGVRPNQIFAVSLPHSALTHEQQRLVVDAVRARLLTPVGLCTLDPEDPEYRGRYEGDLMQRDAAYHNGTVWPWLLGPYAEAVMRVGRFSPDSRAEAARALTPLLDQLEEGWSVGQIPEIFDGDDDATARREPDGCPAQAWSISETLRVWLMSLGCAS